MRKIRIGKEITCVWRITTNGTTQALAGRGLSLFLISPTNTRTELEFTSEGNAASFRVLPYVQRVLGVYRLEMWENRGESGQTVADQSEAFELVPRNEFESDGTASDITAAIIDLGTASLAVGVKGDTGATGPAGPQGPAGSDANVTEENIILALGYTPADEAELEDFQSELAGKVENASANPTESIKIEADADIVLSSENINLNASGEIRMCVEGAPDVNLDIDSEGVRINNKAVATTDQIPTDYVHNGVNEEDVTIKSDNVVIGREYYESVPPPGGIGRPQMVTRYTRINIDEDGIHMEGDADANGSKIATAATIGNNADLATDEKATIVAAINEVAGNVGDFSTELTELSGNVVKMVTTTYAALKAKRDAGQLVAGMQYRITDYACTTTQENTQSAGHVFDIIVTADSTDTLNENARAIQHDGDTYFADCDLSAWELKYCLDNDTDRFLWADRENGKGVIFYMKDEWNNECPYDFKNIMFLRIIARDEDEWGWVVNEDEGEDTYLHTFSAYDYDNDEWKDASMCNGLAPDDGCCSCQNNNIKEYAFDYDRGAGSCCIKLNNIVFMNVFSEDDYSYFECFYNTFGNYCYYNTFGDDCYSNTFGNDCNYNTFGNGCNYNTFGNGCYSNTFGDDCYYNTFGNGCFYNTFGNICYSNTFGNKCSYNTFGNHCSYNTFGEHCSYNTFGEQVQNNKTLKSYIRYVTIENGVQYVNITTSATTSGSNYAQNIHINSGVCGTYNSRKTCSISSTNNAFLTTFGSASDTTINV